MFVVGDDDGGVDVGVNLLLTLLVVSDGAEIVALLVREATLLLFVVATCCLGLTLLDTCVADPAVWVVDGEATDVDVVVGDEGDKEDVVVFFTVFGILHMRASVVLTTFRLGLLGLHSSALSLADIVVVVLGKLADGDDDNCCAYALKVLTRVAARGIPKVNTIPTSNVVWFISNYVRITSIYKK
jgi:hypothetical protein